MAVRVAIAGWAACFTDAADASSVCVDAFFDAPVLGGDVVAMYVDDRDGVWIGALMTAVELHSQWGLLRTRTS